MISKNKFNNKKIFNKSRTPNKTNNKFSNITTD